MDEMMDYEEFEDYYDDYDDDVSLDSFDGISEDALCVCGDIWCLNISKMTTFESLTHATEEEKETMHTALKSQDCGHVCQLLRSGVHLCCEGEDNCIVNIVKYWKFPFINSVLKLHPSAVSCRDTGGNTLLMLSDTLMKLEVVMKYGPDVNAVNDEGESLLHHAVKYRLNDTSQKMSKLFKEFNQSFDDDDFLWSSEVQSLLKESNATIEFIIKSGVDLNIEDAMGNTALQVLLQLFKCGYVLRQFHSNTAGDYGFHNEELCTLDNEITSQALSHLLRANAAIPPPDDFGRTALMMAALSPWNVGNMMLIMERGVVDIKAKDQNGFNAIFYMLSSFAQHFHLSCRSTFIHKSSEVDKMTYILHIRGCEIQGTDIIMFESDFDTSDEDRFKVITHLMTIKDSKLNQCEFPEKMMLKNDTENDTFLELYVHNRRYNDYIERYPWHLEMNDVDIIEKEISQGLNVSHRRPTSKECTSPDQKWSKQLCIPNAIVTTVYLQLDTIHLNRDLGALVHGIVPDRNYYLIVERIQRLFLPFWPHPPVALVLMCYYGVNLQPPHVSLRKKLLEFLFDVGGPLPPGSELYIAVKNTFELAAQQAPLFTEVLDLFLTLHSEVPTLQHLARTALRGGFKFGRTDGVGLDLSSLRVKWQGNMLVVPQLIKNFINFKPLLFRPVKKT